MINEPGDPPSCSGLPGASTSKTQLGGDLCHSHRGCFCGDPPPAGRDSARWRPACLLSTPLTSSPPPAGRPPLGREPLGRLSAPGRRRVTGAGGGRDAAAQARAGEGDPRSSSSSSGGRSPGKSPLRRRRRRRRKRRERRRGRKPPWCPCSRCRGGRSSPRLSVSGGGCLVAFP